MNSDNDGPTIDVIRKQQHDGVSLYGGSLRVRGILICSTTQTLDSTSHAVDANYATFDTKAAPQSTWAQKGYKYGARWDTIKSIEVTWSIELEFRFRVVKVESKEEYLILSQRLIWIQFKEEDDQMEPFNRLVRARDARFE